MLSQFRRRGRAGSARRPRGPRPAVRSRHATSSSSTAASRSPSSRGPPTPGRPSSRRRRTRPASSRVESFTISWLPATGEVKPWKLPGRRRARTTPSRRRLPSRHANKRPRLDVGPVRNRCDPLRAGGGPAAVPRERRGSLSRDRLLHAKHAASNTASTPSPTPIRSCSRSFSPSSRSASRARAVWPPGTCEAARSSAARSTHDWVLPAIGADRYPVIRRYPGERIRREFR